MTASLLTDAQIIELLSELPKSRRKRIIDRVRAEMQAADTRKPLFGSAKDDILYMAEDFDAPLDEFREYT